MEKTKAITEETKPDHPQQLQRTPDLRILHLDKGSPFRCTCGNTKFELSISSDAVVARCATMNCTHAFMVISNKIEEP